jgi:small subunit ribosomal protein S17
MDKTGRRKIREGIVMSNKMAKTVTVRVSRTIRHPIYDKVITRGKKYYAHIEGMEAAVGQRVRIEESRPLSKLKRWRVIEVMA